MKKVFLLLMLVYSTFSFAQTANLSKEMTIYKDACLKMLEGIDKNFDKYTLYDAIELYKKIDIELIGEGNYREADAMTKANEAESKLRFTPEYADSIILYREIVMLDEVSLMREMGVDVLLIHKGIKPLGKISYLANGSEHCEMLVVAESGADVVLTVEDVAKGVKYTGQHDVSNNVSWTSWELPKEESEYKFTIENKSNKTVSLVIAINGF